MPAKARTRRGANGERPQSEFKSTFSGPKAKIATAKEPEEFVLTGRSDKLKSFDAGAWQRICPLVIHPPRTTDSAPGCDYRTWSLSKDGTFPALQSPFRGPAFTLRVVSDPQNIAGSRSSCGTIGDEIRALPRAASPRLRSVSSSSSCQSFQHPCLRPQPGANACAQGMFRPSLRAAICSRFPALL